MSQLASAWKTVSVTWRFVVVCLAALIVRAVYAFLLVGPTPTTDMSQYLARAEALLTTGDFGPPIWSPGYPVAMATIIGLFGHYPHSVMTYGVILSTLACGLIYLASRELFGEKVGVLAAAYSTIYYPLVDYSRYLLTETQFIFFLVLSAALLSSHERISKTRLLAGGAALGFAAFSRGTGLAIMPFVLLLGLTALGPRSTDFRSRLPSVGLLLAGFAIVVMPWTLRNALRYGHFTAVASEGGYVFYLGADEGWVMQREWDLEKVMALTGHSGNAQWDFYGPEDEGPLMKYWFQYWLIDPVKHIRLRLVSFYDFWWPIERVYFPGVTAGTVYRWIGYAALLPFAAVGAIVALRRRQAGTYFVLAVVIGVMTLQTLTYANEERLRVPVSPFLIILAAFGVAWAQSTLQQSRTSRDNRPRLAS